MANKKGINIAKRINGIKKELDDIAAGYENLKNSNSNPVEKKNQVKVISILKATKMSSYKNCRSK